MNFYTRKAYLKVNEPALPADQSSFSARFAMYLANTWWDTFFKDQIDQMGVGEEFVACKKQPDSGDNVPEAGSNLASIVSANAD